MHPKEPLQPSSCPHTPKNGLHTQGVVHHISPVSSPGLALTPLPSLPGSWPSLASLLKALPCSAQLHICDLSFLSSPWHLAWTRHSKGPCTWILDTNGSACDQVPGTQSTGTNTPPWERHQQQKAVVLTAILWVRRRGQTDEAATALMSLEGLRSTPGCLS